VRTSRCVGLSAAILLVCWTGGERSFGGLVNSGFEDPILTPGAPSFHLIPVAVGIPGWKTTDTHFEIWSDGFAGVFSYEGTQHAELNAFIAGTLFQDSTGIAAGVRVGFEFAHRARAFDGETMRLTITDLGADDVVGGGNDTVLFTSTYSGIRSAWTFHDSSALPPIISLGNTTRFAYSAVAPAGSIGNFLDAVDFGTGVGGAPPGGGAVPEPGTVVLLGVPLACAALAGSWRRRRAQRAE
jgi:hypothetical protein